MEIIFIASIVATTFFNVRYFWVGFDVYTLLKDSGSEIYGRKYDSVWDLTWDSEFLKNLFFNRSTEFDAPLSSRLKAAKLAMSLTVFFGLLSYFTLMAYGLINGKMMFS